MNKSISSWFNIQDINTGQTSLVKVLMIFYILNASNSNNNLLSNQIREYIKDNKYIQHIIGFITMFILVTLSGVVDNRVALFYALIGYIWFIFSTKLDIHWNLIIFILLFVGYMIENNMNVSESLIKSDNTLSDKEKESIITANNDYSGWLVGGIIIITCIGTVFYSHKKQEQYGGSYDIFAYMLR